MANSERWSAGCRNADTCRDLPLRRFRLLPAGTPSDQIRDGGLGLWISSHIHARVPEDSFATGLCGNVFQNVAQKVLLVPITVEQWTRKLEDPYMQCPGQRPRGCGPFAQAWHFSEDFADERRETGFVSESVPLVGRRGDDTEERRIPLLLSASLLASGH